MAECDSPLGTERRDTEDAAAEVRVTRAKPFVAPGKVPVSSTRQSPRATVTALVASLAAPEKAILAGTHPSLVPIVNLDATVYSTFSTVRRKSSSSVQALAWSVMLPACSRSVNVWRTAGLNAANEMAAAASVDSAGSETSIVPSGNMRFKNAPGGKTPVHATDVPAGSA